MKKRSNSIQFILIITFIIISTICLSIGYSDYESNLIVSAFDIKVRPDKNVRITSSTIEQIYSSSVNNFDYNIDYINGDFVLSNEDSQVTFLVEVKNFGNVEVGIKDFILNDEYKDILMIETTEYEKGSLIMDNQGNCINEVKGCKLDIKKTFYLTIKYKENAYNSLQTTFNNVKILFDFKPIYKISYSIIDEGNYPINVFEGDDLNIVFDSNPSNIIVIGSNNYTYSNGILNIYNITSDLEIEDPSIGSIQYTISYSGLDSITNLNYPTSISRGYSFEIEYNKLYTPTINGSNNYIIDNINGIIRVNKVINDIQIVFTKSYTVDYVVQTQNNTIRLSLPSTRINQTSGTEVTTLFASGNKMSGVNLENKSIKQITVEIEYVGPAKGADIIFNCTLNATDPNNTANNINTTKSVTLLKKNIQKTTTSVVFDSLNLGIYSEFDFSNVITQQGKPGFKIYKYDIIVEFNENI